MQEETLAPFQSLTAQLTPPPIVAKETAPIINSPKESAKPRATLNLNSIFKTPAADEEVKEVKNGTSARLDEPFTESSLRAAWHEYAELRKGQVAEYHLLTQPFTVSNNLITLAFTNPVEEAFLVAMKADLLGYLREKLKNNSIQLEGILQHTEVKKRAYTNKERFEYLAEKNHLLKQLQEKFGLDPDF